MYRHIEFSSRKKRLYFGHFLDIRCVVPPNLLKNANCASSTTADQTDLLNDSGCFVSTSNRQIPISPSCRNGYYHRLDTSLHLNLLVNVAKRDGYQTYENPKRIQEWRQLLAGLTIDHSRHRCASTVGMGPDGWLDCGHHSQVLCNSILVAALSRAEPRKFGNRNFWCICGTIPGTIPDPTF